MTLNKEVKKLLIFTLRNSDLSFFFLTNRDTAVFDLIRLETDTSEAKKYRPMWSKWAYWLLTYQLKKVQLCHSCLCAPGCQVNRRTSAKWVRVEMGARPWPHASASSPVPYYHRHYCCALRHMLLRPLGQQTQQCPSLQTSHRATVNHTTVKHCPSMSMFLVHPVSTDCACNLQATWYSYSVCFMISFVGQAHF